MRVAGPLGRWVAAWAAASQGPCECLARGAGRSRPASSHRIGRWLTRAPAAAPAPAAVASAAPSSAATSPISRPATMPQTQGTLAGRRHEDKRGTGFLPWTGRRARAGRTLSSSSNRSFVFATPETPGWKGGIGLPKALHAMWSPVSLFTTCVVPTTWSTQMTGCCRRPLFGDLRRWRDQRRSSWGWDGPSTGRGRAHRCRSKPATDLSRDARHVTLRENTDQVISENTETKCNVGFFMASPGAAVGHGGRRATVRVPHLSSLSLSGLSGLSSRPLARAEVTCTQFGSDLKRRGVGSSSLPLGPDYDIH